VEISTQSSHNNTIASNSNTDTKQNIDEMKSNTTNLTSSMLQSHFHTNDIKKQRYKKNKINHFEQIINQPISQRYLTTATTYQQQISYLLNDADIQFEHVSYLLRLPSFIDLNLRIDFIRQQLMNHQSQEIVIEVNRLGMNTIDSDSESEHECDSDCES